MDELGIRWVLRFRYCDTVIGYLVLLLGAWFWYSFSIVGVIGVPLKHENI